MADDARYLEFQRVRAASLALSFRILLFYCSIVLFLLLNFGAHKIHRIPFRYSPHPRDSIFPTRTLLFPEGPSALLANSPHPRLSFSEELFSLPFDIRCSLFNIIQYSLFIPCSIVFLFSCHSEFYCSLFLCSLFLCSLFSVPLIFCSFVQLFSLP